MPEEFQNLHISQHPLIQDKLCDLRQKSTPHFRFKQLLEEISQFLFYEASKTLSTRKVTIETPLENMEGEQLTREILLVPILRAGLGMVNGITQLWEGSRVGMLGMYRDHDTLQPVDYYLRLPENLEPFTVFLLDPMLATGGSAVSAITRLKERGARELMMLSLICAPEGVRAVSEHYPEVPIYAAALDRQLNEKGYILPGLGDAGDRYFGV
ncbi:MAG: uracil phosphoribosyltransferase [Calditrichaeota bacterium]|nr:MAG: uracil phosphoribosyltransferase [Calditrichota bacterium]